MSTLIVDIVEFDVERHPNADKLSIAKIRGKAWQCVINHDQWNLWEGDVGKGLYIPIDSVLPENLIQEHNLANYIHKGRIRSIRLRSILSQGLLLPIGGSIPDKPVGENLAEELNIQKYNPPIPIHLSGEIERKPESWQGYTDIQNIKSYPNIFQEGEQVIVLEKLHGSNMSCLKWDDKLWVSSRNLCLKRSEINSYWRAILPMEERLLEIMKNGWILFGELLGVQDLKYGYDKGNVGIKFFDLFKETNYVNWNEFELWATKNLGEKSVAPKLYVGPYNYQKMEELSKGNTIIEGINHMREGIVIRLNEERFDEKIGRVILKFVNDEYLLREGRTEFH